MEESKVCSKCYAYIPEDSIYCPSCGIHISEVEQNLEYITKDIHTTGEKKFITAIFVILDQKGDKKYTEEELLRRKDIIYQISKLAKNSGAWVDKWLGLKGIMMIFGIPRVTKMDPELACKLALEIRKLLENEKEIIYRIGINSGRVYFGKVGSSLYLHKTVIGDTVNIAYRLAEIAHSEIIISEELNSLVEEKFHTIKKKKIFLKGTENIISIYELKGLREQTKRMRFRIPFVGREGELNLLNSYATLAERYKGGTLLFKGPAGIGKTTLKNYWLKTFKNKNKFFIIEGEPVFEIHESPLRIILRAIEKFAEKEENSKLIENIEEYEELKELLSQMGELEPASYLELVKFTLRRFLEALLKIKPVIFIIDSMEKIDETTKTVLEYLLVSLENKMFFLFMGRENLLSSELAFIKEKNLRPFDFKETEKILRSFLKENIDIKFVKKFLDITEGIPLYVTEFLKVIHKKKTLSLEIPGTLIGAIIEFYDILSSEEKNVLEKLSILIEWDEKGPLKEIFSEQEREIINNFVEEEIIEKEGNTYRFINPLIRNVVYNAILKKKKIDTHLQVVKTIDHKVDIKDISPYLFYHSYNGELWDKAMEFAILSGKQRITSGAFKEAIDYFNKAEECFNKIKGGDIVVLTNIFEYKAEAERNIGFLEEAIKDLHRGIVITEGIKDNKLFYLKEKLAELYLEKNEIQSSKKILLELLENRENVDEETLISTYLTLGEVYFNMGQYHLSLSEYHRAYNLIKLNQNKKIYKIALELAKLHIEMGNFQLAKEYIETAEEDIKPYKDIIWEFKLKENKFKLYIKIGNFQKIVNEINAVINKAKFLENQHYQFVFTAIKALANAYLRNRNIAKKSLSEALKMSRNFLSTYDALLNMAKTMYFIGEKEYLLKFLNNLHQVQENFSKSLLIEFYTLVAKISDSQPEDFLEKAFEVSKSLPSPYLHLLIFVNFVELYKKMDIKDKTVYYFRKANYLLKEIANKFKDKDTKNTFLLHPDFEVLRIVSFFTF